MKGFLFKLALFSVCVLAMDFVSGFAFSWLRRHARGGSTANCEYIANLSHEDVVILGSSRATHHYVPQIIEDSLGVSCYNCGEEGNGVVLAYGRLKMMTDRYQPKLVVYEVTPSSDYGMVEPNSRYLGYLRSYYYKDGIKEIFLDFGGYLETIKMISKMYQNTGRLMADIWDNFIYRDNHNGFEPLTGEMSNTTKYPQLASEKPIEIDSLKLYYLEKLINLCRVKQIPLCFIISPRYGASGKDMSNYAPAFTLCTKYNVPIYNFLSCPTISSCPTYFQDEGHMNYKGAEAFTNLLVMNVINKNMHYDELE